MKNFLDNARAGLPVMRKEWVNQSGLLPFNFIFFFLFSIACSIISQHVRVARTSILVFPKQDALVHPGGQNFGIHIRQEFRNCIKKWSSGTEPVLVGLTCAPQAIYGRPTLYLNSKKNIPSWLSRFWNTVVNFLRSYQLYTPSPSFPAHSASAPFCPAHMWGERNLSL